MPAYSIVFRNSLGCEIDNHFFTAATDQELTDKITNYVSQAVFDFEGGDTIRIDREPRTAAGSLD